jgi:protein-S-isoprenylcysteine O-methyltransferase Ste14
MTAPYQQQAAQIAFWVVFGLFALGECAMQVRSGLPRDTVRAERSVVVVAAIVGGFVAGIKLASWQAAEVTTARWPFFVTGLLVMISGIALRQWAILTLGQYFTGDVRVQANQTVVERGPYQWVRHPSYTGLITFFVGLGLGLTNWAS